MRKTLTISLVSIAASMLLNTSSLAADAKTNTTAAAPKEAKLNPQQEKTFIEACGYVMGKQTAEGVQANFNFSEAEKAHMVSGMMKGAQGKEAPIDFKNEEVSRSFENYLEGRAQLAQQKREQESAKQAEINKKDAMSYFQKLENDKNVKKTASGLYYEITKPGAGKKPSAQDTVVVHYVGKLTNGNEFDSSVKRKEPATFSLEQVIPGFTEGLQLVNQGGSIRLHVPSDLGYGDRDIPGIPANSTLIFDVDLLEIK